MSAIRPRLSVHHVLPSPPHRRPVPSTFIALGARPSPPGGVLGRAPTTGSCARRAGRSLSGRSNTTITRDSDRRLGSTFAAAVLIGAAVVVPTLGFATLAADETDGRLDIYWIDVEGGAATLLVTPQGETVLVDTGNPGERDSSRIEHVVREVARKDRIDHLVVTHFDSDHYGGSMDLAKRLPIDRVYDPGIPGTHPYDRWTADRFTPYVDAFAGKRHLLRAGDALPLEVAAERTVSIRCLASKQGIISPRPGQRSSEHCQPAELDPVDRSENRNSTVLLVAFGEFRFLDAADLTWNLERQLVCPIDLVGQVDVYQVDHHGLDSSNNRALVRTIAPTVAVMNSGATKGCGPRTVDTLRTTPSIEAIYQMHRCRRSGDEGLNTSDEMIANDEADCDAAFLHLSVAPDGASYTVSNPAKSHEKSFATR